MAEIVVLITTGSEEEARTLSRVLVKEGRAACVNIVPTVQSIFRWEGEIVEEQESLLIVKTRAEVFEPLVSTVKKHHSYSVPEIISLPIHQGSEEYLRWVNEMTQPSTDSKG